jgi:citrate lyase beta subunit
MADGRSLYARMRSVLEVPILNDKYWSKVPTADADAIMIDFEDSATPNNKTMVRERTIEALANNKYFGGRFVIVRVNNLSTPWGHDDLAALAEVEGDFLICYPKVETAAELGKVRSLMTGYSAGRGLYLMIETARAMIELDRIASSEGVVGLHFGYVDYAADVGSRPFNDTGDDLYAPAYDYARTKIAVAAAAYRLFATGGTLIPEYKNLIKVAAFVKSWAKLGYTACIALSPAHLDIINSTMSPSAEEVENARELCSVYETAVRRGEPAAVLRGKVITNPDFRVAALILARARSSERTQGG